MSNIFPSLNDVTSSPEMSAMYTTANFYDRLLKIHSPEGVSFQFIEPTLEKPNPLWIGSQTGLDQFSQWIYLYFNTNIINQQYWELPKELSERLKPLIYTNSPETRSFVNHYSYIHIIPVATIENGVARFSAFV